MSVATMTSKGQITIPINVRKELGVEAGSKLEFIPDGKGAFRIVAKKLSVMDLFGSIPSIDRTVTLEEMDAAIAEEATKGYRDIKEGDSR